MRTCKVCGEKLRAEDKFTRTCKDCENAIAKMISWKVGKGIYSSKLRWKNA